MKLFLIVLCLVVTCVQALNILAIYPYHGKSHFIVYKVLLRELVEKGHNVTVISHFPEEDPLKNYHDINLAGTIEIMENGVPPSENFYYAILETSFYLASAGKKTCEVLLANKEVQELIKSKPKFDVVVTEQFNTDCSLAVAYKLDAPVVATLSSVLLPYQLSRLGIPTNPSYVAFHFLGGGDKPTLYQRIERIFFDLYFKVFHILTQQADLNILAKYFDNIPPLDELARDVNIWLVYNNFVLTGSKLWPANVIEVGGYHVSDAKPLTGDLKKFVEDAKHGVVYISFGSMVKSSSMTQKKVQAILEAIQEFPQRFIWKWQNESVVTDKNKLFVSSWLPQVDIIGHNNTIGFVSHAGMGGTAEALHFGVPMVATPLFGDQPSNAAAIQDSGLGVQFPYSELTKENLVAALKTVLDPKFRATVKQVSLASCDRPVPPLAAAVFWTEFAARNPRPFRTAAATVPFYQYMFLDVATIVLAIFVILYGALFLCRKKTIVVNTKKLKKPKKE